MLSNFLTIPIVGEKIKVKVVLAIHTRASATLVKEILDTPPLVALNAIKTLSMKSKAVTYLLNFFCFFD